MIAIKQSFRRLTGSSPLFNFAWFLKQKEVLHSYAKPLINYGDDGESFAFIEPVPPVVAVHGSSFRAASFASGRVHAALSSHLLGAHFANGFKSLVSFAFLLKQKRSHIFLQDLFFIYGDDGTWTRYL